MTKTILFIEDQPLARLLVTNGLRGYGFRFLQAVDGQEAMRLWQAHHKEIDLVLSDICIPGQNGVATLQQIRRMAPSLPYIICTAVTHREIVRQCAQLGVSAYMAKPVSMVELKTRIFQLLGMALDGFKAAIAPKRATVRPAPKDGTAVQDALKDLLSMLPAIQVARGA